MSNNFNFSRFKSTFLKEIKGNNWHIDFVLNCINKYYHQQNRRYKLMNNIKSDSFNLFDITQIKSFRGDLKNSANIDYDLTKISRFKWGYRSSDIISLPLSHIINENNYKCISSANYTKNSLYYLDYRIEFSNYRRNLSKNVNYNSKNTSYFIFDTMINLNRYLYDCLKEKLYELFDVDKDSVNISLYKIYKDCEQLYSAYKQPCTYKSDHISDTGDLKYRYKPFIVIDFSKTINIDTGDYYPNGSNPSYLYPTKSILFFTEDNVHSVSSICGGPLKNNHDKFVSDNTYTNSELPKHYTSNIPYGYMASTMLIGNLFNNLYVSFENKSEKKYYSFNYDKNGLKGTILNSGSSIYELNSHYINLYRNIYADEELDCKVSDLTKIKYSILHDISDKYNNRVKKFESRINNLILKRYIDLYKNNKEVIYDSMCGDGLPVISILFRTNYYKYSTDKSEFISKICELITSKNTNIIKDISENNNYNLRSDYGYLFPQLRAFRAFNIPKNDVDYILKDIKTLSAYYKENCNHISTEYTDIPVRINSDYNLVYVSSGSSMVNNFLDRVRSTAAVMNNLMESYYNDECFTISDAHVFDEFLLKNMHESYFKRGDNDFTESYRMIFKVMYLITKETLPLINKEIMSFYNNLFDLTTYTKLIRAYKTAILNINRVRRKRSNNKNELFSHFSDIRHVSLSDFFTEINFYNSINTVNKITFNCERVR